MNGHFIRKCSCGAIIAQCRCPDPNKTVETVKNGCSNCQARVTRINLPPKE